MRKRAVLAFIAALIAGPALAQPQMLARAEDRLEPESSTLGGTAFDVSYENRLRDTFKRAYEQDVLLRMIALPVFIPEYAVGLRGTSISDRRAPYVVFNARAPYHIFTLTPAASIWTGAESLIAATPEDCYDCIRVRGMIAAQVRDWNRADIWFAKAVHDGPSLPFANADWGQSLLARGQPDGAIEKFKLSNQKGPHFADPLEGWGEALIAKNQSHLALAKFVEAEKYAPNWGRLHLKWGEALYYAGKRDEAAKQFARAAQLDPAAGDKPALEKWMAPHGS